MNIFFSLAYLVELFPTFPERKQKVDSFASFLRPGLFKILNQIVYWTPKPLVRQITVFFSLKVPQLNKLNVVSITCRRESRAII